MKEIDYQIAEKINQNLRSKNDVDLIMKLDAIMDHPIDQQEDVAREIIATLKNQKNNF